MLCCEQQQAVALLGTGWVELRERWIEQSKYRRMHTPTRQTSDWSGGWPSDEQMTFSTQSRPRRSILQTPLNIHEQRSRSSDIDQTSQERLENGWPPTGHNSAWEDPQRRMSTYPIRLQAAPKASLVQWKDLNISFSFQIKIANICKMFYLLSFRGTGCKWMREG